MDELLATQSAFNNRALTPEQVAEMFQVNQMVVYQMIRRGELPAKRIGRLYRISPAIRSWFMSGKDEDIMKMEKTDEQYLPQINSLLKSVRQDKSQ